MASTEAVRMIERMYAETDVHTRAILDAQPPITRVVDIPMVIGALGVAAVVDDHVFFRLGLNGIVTVVSWSLAATVSASSTTGDVTVDVLVGPTMAAAASICGTHLPALSAAAELDDQAPATDWTPRITDPNWIMAKITAVDGTLEVISLTLRCAVAPK